METTPKFIKDFSKEESPEERQKVAQSVRGVRQEYFTETKRNEEKRLETEKLAKEKESALTEKLESINKLKSEISRLSKLGLIKILNYFELKKLQADLVVSRKKYEELKQQKESGSIDGNNDLEQSNNEETPSHFQEAKTMVDEFYSDQEKKWGDSEYKKEDIEKYFSEDNLASLSTEEYILLLKRFPSEMVTHVTRQGIRDHIGLMYHTAGDGEYANGFKSIIDDGRLRSPLGVYLVEEEKDKAVAKFLGLESAKTKDDALKNLNTMTDPVQGESGSFVDRMAIHFATEEVADAYYGSEKGNEIFITYPSAHIASQYYFQGQLNQAAGGYWNDQWVWANEEKGISLNAGIVFIPEEASVDKITGSRYELDGENNPIKNQNYLAVVRKFVDSYNFDDFAQSALGVIDKLSDVNSIEQMKSSEPLKPLILGLEKDFDIVDPKLQYALLDYQNLLTIVNERNNEKSATEVDLNHDMDSVIEASLKNKGILFKETENKINSKEYWKLYFEKNAKSKPKHIVYYRGENPTAALNVWKEENGLNKKASDKSIGFEKNNISGGSPQAMAGLDRFKSLAEKVIENYYFKKSIEE